MKEKLLNFFFVLFFVFLGIAHISDPNVEKKKEEVEFYKIENLKQVSHDTPYENDNFIYLQRILHHEDGTLVKISSASGIALKSDGEKIWGMTVAHFCVDVQEKKFIDSLPKKVNLETWASLQGEIFIIDKYVYDIEKDLCVISFKSDKKVKTIKWAKHYPNVGEKIYTSSSPQGIFSHEIRLHFEGRFGGCQYPGYCFYTIPGTMGSSGSGVLDRRGDLVSILAVSIVDFNHITGGAKLEDIAEMYIRYIP